MCGLARSWDIVLAIRPGGSRGPFAGRGIVGVLSMVGADWGLCGRVIELWCLVPVMDWVRIVSSVRREEKRREGRKRRKRNQMYIPHQRTDPFSSVKMESLYSSLIHLSIIFSYHHTLLLGYRI
jgi:hypothetical protein